MEVGKHECVEWLEWPGEIRAVCSRRGEGWASVALAHNVCAAQIAQAEEVRTAAITRAEEARVTEVTRAESVRDAIIASACAIRDEIFPSACTTDSGSCYYRQTKARNA